MHSRQRVGIVILAMALLGTACAGDDDDDNEPAAQSTPARQELTVGITDPQYVVALPRANVGYDRNIAEPLLVLSPQYEVKPLLAERYEFRAPNTWRFFLRRGVTFHDGQPFNAQAVKVGLFDRLAATPGGGTIRAGTESAVVVDEFTIDYTPLTTNLRVPEQIVHPSNVVVAPGTDMTAKPVGTGPFRFVEYQPGERIVVERNDNYWGTKTKLDRITFRFLNDNNTRRLALESGEVDLILNVATSDARSLQTKGFEVATSGVGAYDALYLSIRGNPPWDLLGDRTIRQAVAGAIDRRAIATGVLDGQATPDATMIPPASLGPHASLVKGVAFDPAKSRTMLNDAGWRAGADGIREKDGRKLKLQLVSGFPSAEALRPIPVYIQTQMKEIGIDLEIVERPDTNSYQALVTSGQGDMFIEQGNQNDANPSFLPVLLFYSGGAGASADYVGLFGPGPQFDQIIAPALTEVDSDKVRRITAEAMRFIIDQEAVVVPLAGIPRIYGMKKSVQGFQAHPSTVNIRWDGISIR